MTVLYTIDEIQLKTKSPSNSKNLFTEIEEKENNFIIQ
jgi:hypothetical protein